MGNLSGNELTCNSSGNAQAQSSQLAEPLWTDHGLKSGIGLLKLISTLKKEEEKKCRLGMDGQTFFPDPHKEGKSHHHLLNCSGICNQTWYDASLLAGVSCEKIGLLSSS